MGVPVIASRTRIDEYYFNEKIVQFFESGNVEDLAAKIVELMQNPARCEELRANGSSFIAGNNWDVQKHRYLQLVDRITGSHAITVGEH